MSLLFVGSYSFASSNVTPVVTLLLQEGSEAELTDRSNIECSLTLDSFSPSVGESIPVGSNFTATYTYQVSQRPLDVEVAIFATAGSDASGVVLGPSEGEILVGIGEGSESLQGQVELSSSNTGVNGNQLLESLSATCVFFTIFDEIDEANNPGPEIGSRIQFTTADVIPSTETVNWFLGEPED